MSNHIQSEGATYHESLENCIQSHQKVNAEVMALGAENDRLRKENYIFRESMKYLAKRESRAGDWMAEWGPLVARAALNVIADPAKLDKFTVDANKL